MIYVEYNIAVVDANAFALKLLDDSPGKITFLGFSNDVLFFRTPSRKLDVSFSLSEAVMAMEKTETIPKDHKFVVSNVNNQTLGVFSQTSREFLTQLFLVVVPRSPLTCSCQSFAFCC